MARQRTPEAVRLANKRARWQAQYAKRKALGFASKNKDLGWTAFLVPGKYRLSYQCKGELVGPFGDLKSLKKEALRLLRRLLASGVITEAQWTYERQVLDDLADSIKERTKADLTASVPSIPMATTDKSKTGQPPLLRKRGRPRKNTG